MKCIALIASSYKSRYTAMNWLHGNDRTRSLSVFRLNHSLAHVNNIPEAVTERFSHSALAHTALSSARYARYYFFCKNANFSVFFFVFFFLLLSHEIANKRFATATNKAVKWILHFMLNRTNLLRKDFKHEKLIVRVFVWIVCILGNLVWEKQIDTEKLCAMKIPWRIRSGVEISVKRVFHLQHIE